MTSVFWDQKSSCYMSVSLNGGTRKSSILIGFSIMFTIHFGGTPIFETPIFLLEVFFVSKNDLHDLPWRRFLAWTRWRDSILNFFQVQQCVFDERQQLSHDRVKHLKEKNGRYLGTLPSEQEWQMKVYRNPSKPSWRLLTWGGLASPLQISRNFRGI